MSELSTGIDVFLNVAFEGPGAIADRAKAHHVPIRLHHLYAGDPVPDAADVGHVVVMGGPMGAHDDKSYPWLRDLCVLIGALVERDQPILGVCLGAQLLAAACGARVYPGPAPEIGSGSVRLTAAAPHDPLFSTIDSPRLEVFHWHSDTFDLPEGATLLASSDRYVNQAFRIGRAWGLQFHVELHPGDAGQVAARLDPGFAVTAQDLAQIEPIGRRIIDAYIDL